jgi:hypothetical protein
VGTETEVKGLTRRTRVQSHLQESTAIAVWLARQPTIKQGDRSSQLPSFTDCALTRPPAQDTRSSGGQFRAAAESAPLYHRKR